MSLFVGILFLIGFIAIWVSASVFSRRATAGDVFREEDHESLEERVEHVQRRLARHRTWWQTGMITGALAMYVVLGCVAYVQSLDAQQEADRQRSRCEFREFLVTFFDELSASQLDGADLAQLDSFQNLDPGTQLFVIDLAQQVEQERITIDEARDAYVESFPAKDCD